ncbi:cardiolipin synthase [Lactobacillus sp. LC28-10]|uniref:Cardiolipin synthase n=1 Tax=Secundilactobacillus angelensis TaxID=2722706 RepID=A0ABX1L0F7_9LACO|nr:cardiolipin synthase [Secundilactobacillus angelensis]MCH5461406.1 cardiolipin synthase [Secundilactobacillus angelensis]NLR17781.1 cardiolipin synthase [Secundilactobacillus angelensis]
MNWTLFYFVIFIIFTLNTIAAVFTVFRERRDIAATWAWLLVLNLLPIIGFLIYAFFGRKLTHKQLGKVKRQPNAELTNALSKQQAAIPPYSADDTHQESSVKNMIHLFQNVDHAFVTLNNATEIFIEGNVLFKNIQQEILNAQHVVYVEFYTFYNDQLGREMLSTLIAKAQEGVTVRVLYDSWGSMGTKREFFEPLREAGGFAEPFLGIHSNWRDFRLNFRDHRKIVAIDGWTGYIGGFNIGDQYVGRSKKFGHWRDTHMKVVGDAALALQEQFIRDWNATVPENELERTMQHFPKEVDEVGKTMMQIVVSGPDSDVEKIKLGYLRMINSARKRLYIQTPYLIPDDSVLNALRSVILSGVDVRIMVPHMPDHPFVYRATQYYARLLAEDGAKIYFYQNGFLHAKVVMIDDAITSIGSANLDFRSFKLNFEANAFVYDFDVAKKQRAIFEGDIKESELVTAEDFHNMSLWLRFKQAGSRLLSPIL